MIRAKKSLGQNFLKSQRVINAMVNAAGTQPGDLILEIGPGKGDLTEKLLEVGATVYAVELDSDMVEILNTKFVDQIKTGRLVLVHGDALEVNTQKLFEGREYKIVANIPYYITGAILRYYLSSQHQPSSVVVLIQKEVAQRIASTDSKESILSLSVKSYGNPKLIMKVKPEAFRPKPKVDSAIILIEDISKENFVSPQHEEQFFKVIKAAFSQKRKKAIKNIGGVVDQQAILEVFEELGLQQNIRAEDISLDTWLKINEMVYNNT